MSNREIGNTASGVTGNRKRIRNYFQVSMGKVIKSLGKEEPADMEGVTSRVNKRGDKVYEIHSDFIRGFITNASMQLPPEEHPEYGKTMIFEITGEDGGKHILQVPFDSAYARGFLYSEPNIELDSPVEFEPYQYFSKKKSRDATGLSIYQHGEKLDWAYGTKANPGGVPPLEKTVYKGQEVWDNTKQLKFLEGRFAEFCARFDTDGADANDMEVNAAEEVATEAESKEVAQTESKASKAEASKNQPEQNLEPADDF